jgi:hypothetical protein
MVVWKRVQVGVGRKDGSIVASHENVGRNATQRISPNHYVRFYTQLESGPRRLATWNMELWGFGASGSYPHSRLLIENDFRAGAQRLSRGKNRLPLFRIMPAANDD